MREFTVNGNSTILIGLVGEEAFGRIRFPKLLFGDVPEGTVYSLVHKRVGDTHPYPVVLDDVGDALIWTVSLADCSVKGYGECQLIASAEGMTGKTFVYQTRVIRSLTEPGPVPEAERGWVDDVLKAGAQAHADANSAQTSAFLASTSADNAEQSATNAHASEQLAMSHLNSAITAAASARTSESNAQESATEATTALNELKHGIESGQFKGDKGDKGEQGERGPVGPQGPKGADGHDGSDATVTEESITEALGYTPADADEVEQKMERYILRLVKNGNIYQLTEYDSGNVLSFEQLYNTIRNTSLYVVCVYGSSKLRPQYVSTNEIMFVGLDRSTETKALRLLVTPTRTTYETFVIAEKTNLTAHTEDEAIHTPVTAKSITEALGYEPTNPSEAIVTIGERALTVGNNLITTEATLGNGWSGNLSTGYNYTRGGNGSLSWSGFEPNSYYLVEFETTYIGGETVTVQIGNMPKQITYNGHKDIILVVASDDTGGDLVMTPFRTDTNNYTLKNISVRKLVEHGTEVSILLDNVVSSGHEQNYGFWNTLMGVDTNVENASGTRNTALGYRAMGGTINGNRNVAIGSYSFSSNEVAERSIGIGCDSCLGAEKLTNNIAIGDATCYNGTDLKYNVAIGTYALSGAPGSTASDNVAIGNNAGNACVSNGNVFIGSYAGMYDATGHHNVIIGGGGCYGAATGNSNVVIGRDITSKNGANNTIALGFGISITDSNQIIIGNSSITSFIIGGKTLHFNEDGTVTWS